MEFLISYSNELVAFFLLCAVIGFGIFCYRFISNKKTDPQPSGVVVAQYEPPQVLPIQLSLILWKNCYEEGFIACVLYLVTKQYIRIEEEAGLSWRLIKTAKAVEADLWEGQALQATFKNAESITKSDFFETVVLENKAWVTFKTSYINKFIYPTFYSESSRKVSLFLLLLAIVCFFATFLVFFSFLYPPLSYSLFCIPVMFGAGYLSQRVLQLNSEGEKQKDFILGFKHYLEVVERERLLAAVKDKAGLVNIPPMLPYALALRVVSLKEINPFFV